MDGNNYGDPRRGRGGYNGYAHGGDRGDDQQQQQQRGYMQNYPGYGQQQQMQAYGQQQGGYPAYAYGNAYGYVPRGGYTQQQMVAYQQAYYGQYANMYNQQQQRQQYGGYGGRGGGYRGVGGRGARGGYPGGDMYHQRGRGGAGGRGGYGLRGPRQEILVVVHTDSFATLNTVSRAGSMLSLVPPRVLETRPQLPHVLRILVVVKKQYLAASVSEPKENQDIILSEETATKFLNVENVLCDEGNLFVDLESGDKLARNLYGQLRLSLVQIVNFDKPEAAAEGDDAADADVFSMNKETLLQDMCNRKSVFSKMEEAMREESERSTKLFEDILRLSSRNLAAAASAAEPAEGEGEDAQQSSATANNNHNNSTTAATTNGPRRTHVLLRSPQGVRLLKMALEHAAKREVFFRFLQEEGNEVSLTRAPAHTAPEGTLFLTLCSSVLTSSLVFHCFGLETKLEGNTQPTPEWTDREHIIDVICARIASEGILLLRSNGGSCMINALVRRLCPGFRLLEAPRSERRVAAGLKRGRADEPTAESTEKVARTEDGAVAHNAGADGGITRAPPSLDGYEVPVPPQDWRFFHACAAAFVEGRIPEKTGGTRRQDNNNNNNSNYQNQNNTQNSTPPTIVTLKAEEITLEHRISLLTDHIISCRAIQVLLPHFADAILTFEKSGATSESDFVRQCTAFLNALTQRGKDLMLHAFGNYVAQSLITELVPRAIPNTRVEAVLNTLTEVVQSNIVELSAQKCASNVVERAIALSEHFPQGTKFVVDATRKILEGDDKALLELATSQYANYVVSLLGKKLSSIPSTASNAEEALAVEKQLYSRLLQNMNQLQNSRFSSGLLNWMTAQQARLKEQ